MEIKIQTIENAFFLFNNVNLIIFKAFNPESFRRFRHSDQAWSLTDDH